MEEPQPVLWGKPRRTCKGREPIEHDPRGKTGYKGALAENETRPVFEDYRCHLKGIGSH